MCLRLVDSKFDVAFTLSLRKLVKKMRGSCHKDRHSSVPYSELDYK